MDLLRLVGRLVERDARVGPPLFGAPLDEATVTSANIQLLDGDQPIAGELSYADKKVTFTPQVPLALLARYQVSVSVGVTDVGGAPLFEASNSSFSVRDGIWTVASAVSRTVGALPLDLPFTEAGNVLLTWSAAGCSPTSASGRPSEGYTSSICR